MIYILGTNCHYENEDLDEIIVMASTNIEDILEHLYNNVRHNYFSDYSILVKENGNLLYDKIYIQDAYRSFVQYTPSMFLEEENIDEFEHVKNQLRIWDDAITEKKRKEKEERDRAFAIVKEKQERELYEKLKAKYGD